MARPVTEIWTSELDGERYRHRLLGPCILSAGSNASDWRGPRAPWSLSVDCTRQEAEALVRALGVGEAKAHSLLDSGWSYYVRAFGDDQADAQALAEEMGRRVAELLQAKPAA